MPRRSPPRGRGSATTARVARRSPTARSPRPRTFAGWMVIDVDSYDRAIELAGELSAAPGANGEPIFEWLEVRPFMNEPPAVAD